MTSVRGLQLTKVYQNERSQDFLKSRDVACRLQMPLRAFMSLTIHRVGGSWLQPIQICFVYQKTAEDIVHDLSKNFDWNVCEFANDGGCLPMITNLLDLSSNFVELHDHVLSEQVNLQVLILKECLTPVDLKSLRRWVRILLTSWSFNREMSCLMCVNFFEFEYITFMQLIIFIDLIFSFISVIIWQGCTSWNLWLHDRALLSWDLLVSFRKDGWKMRRPRGEMTWLDNNWLRSLRPATLIRAHDRKSIL